MGFRLFYAVFFTIVIVITVSLISMNRKRTTARMKFSSQRRGGTRFIFFLKNCFFDFECAAACSDRFPGTVIRNGKNGASVRRRKSLRQLYRLLFVAQLYSDVGCPPAPVSAHTRQHDLVVFRVGPTHAVLFLERVCGQAQVVCQLADWNQSQSYILVFLYTTVV